MHDRRAHWENVYETKPQDGVSWYQERPEPSMELLALTGVGSDAAIVDIGGGASLLVDHLLDARFSNLTVLDLSKAALDVSRARLGPRASQVQWVVGDATEWSVPSNIDVWHDRAAFHFLTDEASQTAYIERLREGLVSGGFAIIGTFAPDGPEKCSGLAVTRYDAETLSARLGADFELIDTRRHTHATPWGSLQNFHFGTFRRR